MAIGVWSIEPVFVFQQRRLLFWKGMTVVFHCAIFLASADTQPLGRGFVGSLTDKCTLAGEEDVFLTRGVVF